jgi:hypothetical protein
VQTPSGKERKKTFRTGLQTPSGKERKKTFRTGLQTPSGKEFRTGLQTPSCKDKLHHSQSLFKLTSLCTIPGNRRDNALAIYFANNMVIGISNIVHKNIDNY